MNKIYDCRKEIKWARRNVENIFSTCIRIVNICPILFRFMLFIIHSFQLYDCNMKFKQFLT